MRSVKTLSALFVCSLLLRHGVLLCFRLLKMVLLVLVILWAKIFFGDLETTLVDVPADTSSSKSVPSSPLIDPHEPSVVKDKGPSSLSFFLSLDRTPQANRQDLSHSSWRSMLCQLEDGEGLVLTYSRIQASQSKYVFLASLLSEEDVGVVVRTSDVMSL